VGYRGTSSTTSHLTLSTRIDDKLVTMSPDNDSLSKTFNSTPGDPVMPFFTFFETSNLTQGQAGSNQHTINVTLDEIVGDVEFAVVQFVYTPMSDSISEAENSFLLSTATLNTSDSGSPATALAPSTPATSPSASSPTPSAHPRDHPRNLAGPLAGGIVICAMLLLCSVCMFLKNDQRRRQRLKELERRPTALQSYSTLESTNPSLIMDRCDLGRQTDSYGDHVIHPPRGTTGRGRVGESVEFAPSFALDPPAYNTAFGR
jgi:hypothetical protein